MAPQTVCIVASVVAATYPGTVSPLRGLDPFGEAERDVWAGRESERDDLAKMVTADGFRAGLLFGEPGVGKTSLVRAGLIPHLRDHGIVALACEDLAQPAASFAAGLSSFGIQPTAQEIPAAFITRAVANAVAGQLFVFVIDDADLLCADDRATQELSEVFAKVVSRSGGRARFLFVAASERMHVLGALERRTGSLFPPSTRFELARLTAPGASKSIDRVLSLSGVAADPALADAVVQGIARGQPLLAADLQIAAMAMRDLKVTTLAALQRSGGPTELESAWLHDACRATGNERSALRLCAELAVGGAGPRAADMVIRRISLDAGYAQQAFMVLEQRGVIVRGDASGLTWMLRHEVLAPRIRELTAPARAAARRAHDLLGSKTATKERLTLTELRALKSEGIAPITPDEIAVVDRSKRHYMMIAGSIAAVPLLLIIIIYVSMRGRVFYALEPGAGGDHVVVRSGRAGLHAFAWLPGSGYGNRVADTGLTRAMVAPEQWVKIEGHDLGSARGSWDDLVPSIMAPRLAGLVDYATTGNDATLDGMRKAVKDNPEEQAELLTELRPIARGLPAESAMVDAALKSQNPSLQRAAVATAGAAAQRHDVYQDQIVEALISSDPELRRIAAASVRNLGERGRALFNSALAKNPDAATRRELTIEVSVAASADETPTAARSAAVLADAESTQPARDRARTQLQGMLSTDATSAAGALATLIANEKAPPEARVFAMELLHDLDPVPTVPGLVDAARDAFHARSPLVAAAALPLYAKLDPVRAGGDLASMLEDKKLDKPMRVAAALAWGEVVATNRDAASNALDRFLKEEDNDVRAAAATAAGKVGRAYQDRLIKMAKAEVYTVRRGAAEGLAASAYSGGNVGVAVDGIAQMWREKGQPRRDSVRVFAHLAKKKPAAVLEYLATAARTPEDPGLHPLGVEGLCNAALAGNPDARRALAKSTDDPSAEVRRLVMSCVADGPDPAKNGNAIAQRLITDTDREIRAEAARVLALAASGKAGKVGPGISDALVKALDDPDRDVRLVAIRAVGGLQAEAPKAAVATMAKMFERADEGEKLALLRAARQIGAAEIVALAITDSAPLVRVAAVDAALSSGLRAQATLSAALADQDPQVRKAALERIAAQKDKLDANVIEHSLPLAVRDPDPELSQLALTTIARVAPIEAVKARLERSLASREERQRAQAGAAAIGLVDRDTALSIQLLDPLVEDPSHDVRVAMLPALASAYAKTNDLEKLAKLMRDSEDNAMRRLVIAAAFITVAHTDNGRTLSEPVLAKLADSGPPMARAMAKLVSGLIAGKADGMAFLQELVP